MKNTKTLFKKTCKWLIRILVFIIIMGIIIGLGYWGWYKYINRPQVVTSMAEISLEDKVVDVRLALGEPSSEFSQGEGEDKENNLTFIYEIIYDTLDILFKSNENNEMVVTRICSSSYRDDVLDLGVYDSEEKIINKLGEPITTSINAKGLRKVINYPQWNIAFALEKKKVINTCIFSSEEGISFVNEYGED